MDCTRKLDVQIARLVMGHRLEYEQGAVVEWWERRGDQMRPLRRYSTQSESALRIVDRIIEQGGEVRMAYRAHLPEADRWQAGVAAGDRPDRWRFATGPTLAMAVTLAALDHHKPPPPKPERPPDKPKIGRPRTRFYPRVTPNQMSTFKQIADGGVLARKTGGELWYERDMWHWQNRPGSRAVRNDTVKKLERLGLVMRGPDDRLGEVVVTTPFGADTLRRYEEAFGTVNVDPGSD